MPRRKFFASALSAFLAWLLRPGDSITPIPAVVIPKQPSFPVPTIAEWRRVEGMLYDR